MAEAIRRFKFDLAVISCSALDQDGDLLDFDIGEVSVSRTMLRQARKTWLVAGHSKFAGTAPARIASPEDAEVFFTDRALPEPLTLACRQWPTEICVAG